MKAIQKKAGSIERRVKWAREVAKNPDGFEGISPQRLLNYADHLEASNAPILAEARAIRTENAGKRRVNIDVKLAARLDEIAVAGGIARDEATEKCLQLAIAEIRNDPAAFRRWVEERATRAA